MKRMFTFFVVLLVGTIAYAAAPSQVVQLDYTIAKGNIPTLSWSAPWATSCNAGGSWSGVKAPSGTETVAAITGTTSYTLTCVGAGDNQASISWTAPTQHTDGTPLSASDLGPYRLYRGSSVSNLQLYQEVPSLTYVDSNLLVGTFYYAVSAVKLDGTESALSGIGSKTITAAPTGEGTATIRVPNPPMPGTVQ